MKHTICSQALIPVGTWRTHFNYENTELLEIVNDKIYAATPQAIIYYDPEDNSLNSFSKLDVLSDVGISAMAFDATSNTLAVGYENGNLDLITDDGVQNNTVIVESQIVGSKQIKGFSFYDNQINLAADFGLIVIDMETNEVVNSFRNLGPSGETLAINEVVTLNDLMFLATDVGVIMADRSLNVNYQAFESWERFPESLVNGVAISNLAVVNTVIYATSEEVLFGYEDGNWREVHSFSENEILNISASGDDLIIIRADGLDQMNGEQELTLIDIPASEQPTDMLQSMDGSFWFVDPNSGLSRLSNGNIDRFVLNGPDAEIENLTFDGQTLVAFPALETEPDGLELNGEGYSFFSHGQWTQVSSEVIGDFENITSRITTSNGQFLGSFGNGVWDIENQIHYNAANSTLPEDDGGVLVTGMATDRDNNLWVSTIGAASLHRLDAEGVWNSFSFSSTAQEPKSLTSSLSGKLWMPLGYDSNNGILGFDPTTNESREINTSNSSLPSNTINDLVIDFNNEIWIASRDGVSYFPFGEFVIGDNQQDVIDPIFDGGFLFNDKNVLCVAIDGGNRKWFGTDDGAWLLEDSGEELVYHFTKDNSPLPSDEVWDIEVDLYTGEVFFVTSQGLVSYRADATIGTTSHQNVSLFPNPIAPNYHGQVGIRGLASDANLKITTISGRLVREIYAPGGGASWDISDYNGRRVEPGVYLVFSSAFDGEETFVGKIAVIE